MIQRQEMIGNHYGRIALFGMLGGIAITLHDIRRGKKVRCIDFLIDVPLAGIIALTVDLLAPDTRVLQDDAKTYGFAILIGMLNNWGMEQIIKYAKNKFSKLLS